MGVYHQIVIMLPAALVAAHPLECPTAAIATVTVLQQQLIIVAQEPQAVAQEPQAPPWTYATTSFHSPAEPQATRSHAITESPPPGEPPDPRLSQAMTSSLPVFDEDLTISVTNTHGTPLSISFGSNAGGPSPIGNPSATTLAHGSPTQYAFPTGWAGRIYVGPNLNPQGSKIEGSYTGPPDVDISYVDGYSVPITCSSNGTAVAGCNISLFSQPGVACDHQVDGPVCLNSAREHPDGPAPPFFAACQGAAYTYPNDNEANVSNLPSRLITCCIGTSCEAPSRQKFNQTTLTRQGAANRYNSSEHRPRMLASSLTSKREGGSRDRYLSSLALR